MQIASNLNILKKIPIRTEDPGSDTLYFDEDGDGELAMDDLYTDEPLVHTDAADELEECLVKGLADGHGH